MCTIRSAAILLLALTVSARAIAQQPAFDFHDLEPGIGAAVFAGGCFWCMEKPFEELPGVIDAISGFTGGEYERPTYRIVAHGGTGHREAVLVLFDPSTTTYRELLRTFWVNIDPFDPQGQFCDRGDMYQAAIFYRSAVQRVLATRSRRAFDRSAAISAPVRTEILPLGRFWIAEDYHQDYYREHSFNYRYYREKCGRDERLQEIWGERTDDVRRGFLTEF